MGLDCHIYAVPYSKHNKFKTEVHKNNEGKFEYSIPSPFLEDIACPDAYTGDEGNFIDFCHLVAYWRKNWFIYNFFSEFYTEYENADYRLIDDIALSRLIKELEVTPQDEYNAINGNDYSNVERDIAHLKRILDMMREYKGILEFYWEGDY